VSHIRTRYYHFLQDLTNPPAVITRFMRPAPPQHPETYYPDGWTSHIYYKLLDATIIVANREAQLLHTTQARALAGLKALVLTSRLVIFKAIKAGHTIARKRWILDTRAGDCEAEANSTVEEDTPER